MKSTDFKQGERVAIHPAHSCWMQGDRFGNVVLASRQKVAVKLDSGRVRAFSPSNLTPA